MKTFFMKQQAAQTQVIKTELFNFYKQRQSF